MANFKLVFVCSSCGCVHYKPTKLCDLCKSSSITVKPSALNKLNRHHFKRPQLQEDEMSNLKRNLIKIFEQNDYDDFCMLSELTKCEGIDCSECPFDDE